MTQPTPSKVFTIALACLNNNLFRYSYKCARYPEDSGTVLLFHDFDKNSCLLDPEYVKNTILDNPITRNAVDPPFMAALITNQIHQEEELCLAVTDSFEILRWAMSGLELKGKYIHIIDAHDNYRLKQLNEEYYDCTLPAKFMGDCTACFDKEEFNPGKLTPCSLRKIYDLRTDPPGDTEELLDKFKNRKTKISDFTYLSPALTHPSEAFFAPRLRSFQAQSFNAIDTNAKDKHDAASTKSMTDRKEREVCAKCFVQDACQSYYHNYRRSAVRYCSAYYPRKVDTVNQILRKVDSPFSRKEILTLLHNGGELTKRYAGGYRAAASLQLNPYSYHQDKKLCFRVQGLRNDVPLLVTADYKEAIDVLEKYCGAVHSPPEWAEKLLHKNEFFAMLYELLARTYSATHTNGWHHTSYRVAYHSLSYNAVETTYWQGSRGDTLPWSATIRDLSDIYLHFGSFSFADGTPSYRITNY